MGKRARVATEGQIDHQLVLIDDSRVNSQHAGQRAKIAADTSVGVANRDDIADVVAEQRAEFSDVSGEHYGARIEKDEPVAKRLGLDHEVCRQENGSPVGGDAVADDPAYFLGPHRIETSGRLIQDDQAGVVDEPPSECRPLPHPG